ncbi:30S ribosomal protein S5 [Candidatus Peregrinibacteria bacterium RIFOXYB2_FULL_32_7]|nr:MAG: 30S ribosomal protein S5 [Candidatus Peregrinibacteria bacterium RIFOXYB2_FULL_32_7]
MSKPKSQKQNSKNNAQKEFDEVLLELSRVTKVTAGGRQLKFRATVAIGNRKGKIGLGIGKSNEVTGAIQKAVNKAKKNFIKIPIYKTTIPHEIKVKFKSAKILLMPASAGTGLIAGSSIRQILEVSGVKDILAKRFGTTNKLNNAKATFKALSMLRERPLSKKLEAKPVAKEDNKQDTQNSESKDVVIDKKIIETK